MNVKKALFYAAPVALAGFLYLGEATGIGEVLAKTVKTVIRTETAGEVVNGEHQSFGESRGQEYRDPDGDYIYILGTVANSYSKEWVYLKYPIIVTDIVTEMEVPEDVNVKVVPTVDPEAEAAYQRELQEAIEKAREEAEVKVQKEAEQKTEDFVKEIAKMTEQAIQTSAKEDEANGEEAGTPTAVIKTDYFTCFTQDMLKQLAANSNVNYEIHYRYQGKRYVVVIPAGTDYSQLKDSNGYYGFRYLDSIFGGYEEGTK
ncbi:MAG: hypothetical protein Q4E29_04560 [Lachnospiraceae bacterium]|nr:hypothetical protein [Lachnospiraceae bacterium]